MVYDFHTHTTLSDGALIPIELIRRAIVRNYRAIAITDHVSIGSLKHIIEEVSQECALARKHWGILAIPGVELTHVPVEAVAETAQKAKELGAWIVLVHGETIVEPTEKGTNLAALQCPYVDILAHPGLLTLEEAKLASANGKFIEINARKGHSLTNGLSARLAQKTSTKLLLNSDAHDSDDLLTSSMANAIIRGTGLNKELCHQVLNVNPHILIGKFSYKL